MRACCVLGPEFSREARFIYLQPNPGSNSKQRQRNTEVTPFPNVPSHKSVRMSTAEELKALGNKAIAAKDFDEAM